MLNICTIVYLSVCQLLIFNPQFKTSIKVQTYQIHPIQFDENEAGKCTSYDNRFDGNSFIIVNHKHWIVSCSEF
jgi:hypothetical protein